MRMYLLFLFIFFGICFNAQVKKKITTEDYFKWASIPSVQLSNEGNVIVYPIKHIWRNDTLAIYDSRSETTKYIGRSSSSSIHFKDQYVAFKIKNDKDSLRKLELDEIPKKKWAKDSVGVYLFEKDTIYLFPQAKSVTLGKEGGDWMLIKRDEKFKSETKQEKRKRKWYHKFRKKKKKDANFVAENGNPLTFFNPILDSIFHIPHALDYGMSYFGNRAFIVSSKTIADTIDSTALILYDMSSLEKKTIFNIQGNIQGVAFDRLGEQLAFYASADTGEYKVYQLYAYNIQTDTSKLIVDTVNSQFANYQSVNENENIHFSRDGSKLFFGVGNKPINSGKDTVVKSEKYHLDLWSWTDGRLQPQQLLSQKRDKKASADFVYHLDTDKMVQLTDTSANSISLYNHSNSDFALERIQTPYLKEMTWDYWYYDYLRVNVNTGKKDTLLKHFHGWNPSLSPSGGYLTYFEHTDSSWYLMDLNKNTTKNLTQNIDAKFYKKYHDVPDKMPAHGTVNWSLGEASILINSQQDLWIIPINGGKPYRFTKGKETNRSYSLLNLDRDQVYVNFVKGFYLKSFNEKTKQEGIWRYGENGLEMLLEEDARLFGIAKAKKGSQIIYRKSTVKDYPDVYLSDLLFKNITKISDANPQRESYNWATVELVDWKDYNGDSVAGLLYKPEDFDATKKYPMLVYFYERSSNRLHNYDRPRPSASTIHPVEYASNGYLVFIPDIKYKTGHPAQSAYNAIMSGTETLIRKYNYIDSTKMGLQGQSWGGYQTAQLVTMTTKFRAGMAGAPVSNMFSAYGGIRWGSGLSRAFQYETGQSRIGATIWEAPELYIENSPIFHLPNVQTPLLIMHNDGDGAVPWYQGIELFNGLRRLNKPTWMLNYNGDQHNLMKTANRIDLSVRMMQFFDYYLKEETLPPWMEKGIPAIYKGKQTGY